MKFKLVDIHCHLDFPDFDADRDNLIKKTLSEGIWMLTVGTNKESSKKAVEVAEKYDGVFASIGIHPHDASKPFDAGYFRELAKHPKVVAIGECGLDYYRISAQGGSASGGKNSDLRIKNLQKEVFKKQIELALEIGKPLILHCRDSHKEVLDILNSYFLIHNSKLRGDVHFFSGKREDAERYLEMGFSFSFTGVITFTRDYDEVIKKLPLEKIMVETDAPFAAPVPYRGKRCEPAYVEEVAKKIAEIKNVSFEEVCRATTENAIKLFNLK